MTVNGVIALILRYFTDSFASDYVTVIVRKISSSSLPVILLVKLTSAAVARFLCDS